LLLVRHFPRTLLCSLESSGHVSEELDFLQMNFQLFPEEVGKCAFNFKNILNQEKGFIFKAERTALTLTTVLAKLLSEES